jgi:predicted esterase
MSKIKILALLVAIVFLSLAPPSSAQGAKGVQRVEMKKYRSHFMVGIPETYKKEDDQGTEYPLIVGMHGIGDRADNFVHFFTPFVADGYVVIVPQCPDQKWNGGHEGFVRACMDQVKADYRIAEKHVSLAGFSRGAIFGMPFVFSNPELFNALLAMCGGRDANPGKKAQHLKVYLFTGDQDGYRDCLERVHDACQKKKMDVTLKVQADWGHRCPPPEEVEKIRKWFRAFSPEGLLELKLKEELDEALKGLKSKSRRPSAISTLLEISKHHECEVVQQAKKTLEELTLEAEGLVQKALELQDAGRGSRAKGILRGVGRDYKGLPIAERAKELVKEIKLSRQDSVPVVQSFSAGSLRCPGDLPSRRCKTCCFAFH